MTVPSGSDTRSAEVVIYSDGSCLGNPGPGGWGAVLRDRAGERELSGGFRATTNNRMELRAVVEALQSLERPSRVHIHTDSQYVRQGITTWVKSWQRNGWMTSQKQPVKNRDLWQALLAAVSRHATGGGEVTWFWVRGHAGDPLNEHADRLATTAARRVTPADPIDAPLAGTT